ncbi:MAG: hypothetical protein FJY10_11520 [Bacteroidetes bacterium]|nr:hypothetical protein [Bacteroidota bacterium]
MKNSKFFAIMGILLALVIVFSGCKKKKDDEPTVTQVKGSANFPAGTGGDLSNSKVSLYLTYDDWLENVPVKFGAVTGSGASVNFTLAGVLPGNYYLDIWKDNDFSGNWTVGDFVGWYGSGGLGAPSLTPFQIVDGQTFTANVNMYIIAKNGDLVK